MKKIILLSITSVFFLFISNSCLALSAKSFNQDSCVIVALKNGTLVYAKIIKITKDSILYHKCISEGKDNTYSIARKDIQHIEHNLEKNKKKWSDDRLILPSTLLLAVLYSPLLLLLLPLFIANTFLTCLLLIIPMSVLIIFGKSIFVRK